MNILVCVKRVPETSDAGLTIDRSGRDIGKSGLAFDLNEWDHYAIEEAVLLKEKHGGTVSVLSLGGEESNEVLRKCLAMGADVAIRLTDPSFEGSDGYATARILAAAIRNIPQDLILTGTQAEDDGYGQVGVALAEMLGLNHAALVNHVETDGKKVRVHRELEGGLEEILDLDLPAVLTVQTGLNEPRYVSIMGIRRVAQQEIRVLNRSELGLTVEAVGPPASDLHTEKIFLPPPGPGGVVLEGPPEEVSLRILDILKDKGGLA